MNNRYVGTLHKLCDNGAHKKGGWGDLLTYLELHSISDPQATNPSFDSPLPPYTAASPHLTKELLTREGPRKEDTPLRIVCKTAPAHVIAAICHLCPEAAQKKDSRGRTPLHLVCRRPSKEREDERAIKVIVLCYPNGLIDRDDGGRTPLHYLLWYHGATRSTRLVESFLTPLPVKAFSEVRQPNVELPPIPIPNVTSIPPTAAIIPDAKHGCLPLHYAVMEGASRDVVKLLLQAYPSSKAAVDKFGRLALSWYLGAGQHQHVSGEAPDPNAVPLYQQKRSTTIIAQLLNSKSARTIDSNGRCPLHWAAHLLGLYHYHYASEPNSDACIHLKVIQSLLDHYMDATVLQDKMGFTPLHLLFDAAASQQDLEWQRIQRNKTIRDNVDLRVGGGGFSPPPALLEMLLKHASQEDDRPVTAAHLEDPQGHLPLHLALLTACSKECTSLLIQAHPTSLLHTTEDMLTPVHCALSNPFTAPLQSYDSIDVLLQAYVTSRHGTFVNGKVALKMEDSNGHYPLHAACANQACVNVISLLVDTYPKAAILASANGDLPIHCLLDPDHLFETSATEGMGVGATLASPMGWISDSESTFATEQLKVQQECMRLLVQPMLMKANREALLIGSSAHGMLPLHIVVAFDAVDYKVLYQMLDNCPESAQVLTTAEGHEYTALDLHEMRHDSNEKWMNVRELLFAFAPTVKFHRRKDDLLEQCAKVIRDEAEGKGSPHMVEFVEWMKAALTAELEMKQTLSTVEAPEIDRGFKPKTSRNTRLLGNKNTKPVPIGIPPIKPTPPRASSSKGKKKKKSIYDNDEFDHRYYVDNCDDVDDDDYLTEDDAYGDEEYDMDDDTRYRNDDFDEDETNAGETLDSYTYDSRTFDDTMDMRTLDSRITKRGEGQDEELEDGSVRGKKVDAATIDERGFEEEKKEDRQEEVIEAPFLSDVAMRLWTFFVLFQNPEDPRDNYADKVQMILSDVRFPTIKELTSLALPPYAEAYLTNAHGRSTLNQTLGEAAHNACKAVMHKACYFAGRYEFQASAQDSLVMHRSNDGTTLFVRALEYSINVEEAVHGQEETGKAEEEIWATGAAPPPVTDNLMSVFEVTTRKVCIKFMRSQQAYLREVQCRRDLSIPVEGNATGKNFVVPLLNHFSALGDSERDEDRRYRFDLNDDRFQKIDLGGGVTLDPSDFPYAVVLPFRDDGELFEYFLHQGRLEKHVIREIGIQVGKALQAIHQKGLVHGRVSLPNIRLVTPTDENDEMEPYWALTDLTGACNQSTSLMAGIPITGAANFATSLFPPELFVKLSPAEIKLYNAYWNHVQTVYSIQVDKLVIDPHVHPITGDSYVLRCHFEPDDTDTVAELPPLPYTLVPAREPVDVWSFGRVMFTLCSAGHPLFASNIKSGHLLAYDQVANFDHPLAREYIYKYVDDPLAQDLLFHLLGTYEQRAALTMEKILNHPFFCVDGGVSNWHEKAVEQIITHRTQESSAYLRSLQDRNTKQAEGEWVTLRSTNLHCWNLDFSMRMYLAPSTLLRHNILGAPDIPFGAIMLPYKLARSKSGKLTPSTKKDVERAEKMGIHLLTLIKACQFACRMKDVVEDPEHKEKVWTTTNLLTAMDLTVEDGADDLKTQLTQLAATHVERFREDPLMVARRIIQQRIVEIQLCVVDDTAKAYLYLVDEFAGVPVLASPYPREVSEKKEQVLQHTLPIMFMNVVYACAVSGSIAGLVKLIFEAAHPHLPPSWTAASGGVKFELNKSVMDRQLAMLHSSLTELYDSKSKDNHLADLKFLQSYLETCDPKNTYANLKKVTNGDAALWTTRVAEIQDIVQDHDIHSAYEAQKKQERTISEQASRIQELEKALENAEFKRKYQIADVI